MEQTHNEAAENNASRAPRRHEESPSVFSSSASPTPPATRPPPLLTQQQHAASLLLQHESNAVPVTATIGNQHSNDQQREMFTPSHHDPTLHNSDVGRAEPSSSSLSALPQPQPPYRYKTYPAPQYKWEVGNMIDARCCSMCFGDVFSCLLTDQWWHALVLIVATTFPPLVFLIWVRSSYDWVSVGCVPFFTLGNVLCLIAAVTVDPGVYRKRIIVESDRDRVRKQQIQRQNELRAKRGLPLLPMEGDGGSGEGGGAQQVPSHNDAVIEVSDEENPNRLNFNKKVLVGVRKGKLIRNRGSSPIAMISGNTTTADLMAETNTVTADNFRNGEKEKRKKKEDEASSPAATVMIECNMCVACGIMKNPRVGHCFICNVCVDEFDHHCGVVGSCVGRRNFRFFTGILYFTSFLSLYVFIATIIVFATDVNWSETMETHGGRWRVIAGIFLLIICSCAMCSAVPLMGTYTIYACRNTTQKQNMRTFEQIPGTAEAGGNAGGTDNNRSLKAMLFPENPFSSGNGCKDYVLRLFGPMGKSRRDPWYAIGKAHSSHE